MEGLSHRDPEWEEIERGPGQGPSEGREFEWDPVHNTVRQIGPKIRIVKPPLRPY